MCAMMKKKKKHIERERDRLRERERERKCLQERKHFMCEQLDKSSPLIINDLTIQQLCYYYLTLLLLVFFFLISSLLLPISPLLYLFLFDFATFSMTQFFLPHKGIP
jgi:hypothetical protein